jgi:hypothetical protein
LADDAFLDGEPRRIAVQVLEGINRVADVIDGAVELFF